MSWRGAVQVLLAAILVAHSSAKRHQVNGFGLEKHGGWGLKNYARRPLTANSYGARSLLLQVRGGSTGYYGGDDDDDDSDRRKPGAGSFYDDDNYSQGFDSREWDRDDNRQDDRNYYRDDYRDEYSRSRRGSDTYDDYDDGRRSQPVCRRDYWLNFSVCCNVYAHHVLAFKETKQQ